MIMKKKAFITGASRGIGRGIAKELAANGYDIAITYNSKIAEAKSLCSAIEELGSKCYYFQASLQESGVAEKTTNQAIEALGGLDLLVCNAGSTRFRSLLEIDEEFIDFLYNLDFRSYLMCAKTAANYMIKNKIAGNIIFITSTRGIRAYDNDCIYGSLKAALNRAVESMAIEMAEYGIRVNSIAPGATAVRGSYDSETLSNKFVSHVIPLKRQGRPGDVATLVKFLASDDASYITGDTVKVDGGLILSGPAETE